MRIFELSGCLWRTFSVTLGPACAVGARCEAEGCAPDGFACCAESRLASEFSTGAARAHCTAFFRKFLRSLNSLCKESRSPDGKVDAPAIFSRLWKKCQAAFVTSSAIVVPDGVMVASKSGFGRSMEVRYRRKADNASLCFSSKVKDDSLLWNRSHSQMNPEIPYLGFAPSNRDSHAMYTQWGPW